MAKITIDFNYQMTDARVQVELSNQKTKFCFGDANRWCEILTRLVKEGNEISIVAFDNHLGLIPVYLQNVLKLPEAIIKIIKIEAATQSRENRIIQAYADPDEFLDYLEERFCKQQETKLNDLNRPLLAVDCLARSMFFANSTHPTLTEAQIVRIKRLRENLNSEIDGCCSPMEAELKQRKIAALNTLLAETANGRSVKAVIDEIDAKKSDIRQGRWSRVNTLLNELTSETRPNNQISCRV